MGTLIRRLLQSVEIVQKQKRRERFQPKSEQEQEQWKIKVFEVIEVNEDPAKTKKIIQKVQTKKR